MPIDPRILQAILAQTRSQASPSPMGPQGTATPPANPMVQQTGGLSGMPMAPPYQAMPGGAGASGNPMQEWIGVYGMIKRMYPNASDDEVRRMLNESMKGMSSVGSGWGS